ncbi:MAG: c-type cytochrome [Planctomycetes bacterium]|nr:c-type cytochrome [Planctomycetota bacterium]
MKKSIFVSLFAAILGSKGAADQRPLSPEEAVKSFRTAPGFEVELVAAEPDVVDPVAMAFDADGRIYVAEMLDYPIVRTPGMFGPFPEGQVRLLELDDQGQVARSFLFAGALTAPCSVLPYDGGVLVAAAPDLWFLKDTDGDRRADVRRPLLTGFDDSRDLYRVNSLLWGIDGWIYARGVGNTPIRWGDDPQGPALSTEGMDFRFRPREKRFEALSGLSSCFGLTMDNWGRRFFSNSASHVYQVVLPNHYLKRNPFLAAPPLVREIPDHGGVARVFRVSEPQDWRVERSESWEREGLNQKYFGRIEPRQDYMTSTCGAKIYREAAFPEEYQGCYFVCEAVGNLVHRDLLTGEGPVFTARRGEEGREFLASTDPWCCPVGLETGPDGALYICDMYRQMIEHPGPDGGRDIPNVPYPILHKYGMRAGSTMGRIYRLKSQGASYQKPALGRASPAELAAALDSPGAWRRSTAQRLILESPEKAAAEAIEAVAGKSAHPAARAQALWTLEALGKLEPRLIAAALKDESAGVRENAIKLAEAHLAEAPALAEELLGMAGDPNASVRYQLAFTLGEVQSPARLGALLDIARLAAAEPYTRAAILSSSADEEAALFRRAAADPALENLLGELARLIGARLERLEIAMLLGLIGELPGDAARAAALRGLAKGIEQRGKKDLPVPGARAGLEPFEASASAEVRGAAGKLASLIRTLSDAELKAAVEKAAALALDESKPVEERREAVSILGSGELAGAAAALAQLLKPRHPEALQLAAIQALDAHAVPGVAEILFASWPRLSPAARLKALESALHRKERLLPLLEAMTEGVIAPSFLDSSQRAQLLSNPDAEVAKAARAVLEDTAGRIDPQLFEKHKGALELKGDSQRGEPVFKKLCHPCHQSGGEGTAVGPPLASVKEQPREQILKNLLYPSLTVLPNYVQYLLETRDGQIHAGLLASASATSVTLRRQGGEETTILRKDIVNLTSSQVSAMPEDLLKDLDLQQVADLIEFVKNLPQL